MVKGFIGRGLEVNLSSGRLRDFHIEEKIFREYLGGYGLAVRLILEKQPVNADPLGGDSILAFAPGLLPGTDAPFSGRFSVAGKSPLTGAWGDANGGGYFGPELKKSGYDIILVSGVSQKPVYIFIENGKAALREAVHLWGKDTVETESLIRKELRKPAVQVACIGSSGERKSLISCVITDGRAAARSGLGAVMGSKRLKAVVVRGGEKVPVANEALFEEISSKIRAKFKRSLSAQVGERISRSLFPLLLRLFGSRIASLRERGGESTVIEIFRRSGTSLGLAMAVTSGDAPIKNWAGVGVRDFPFRRARKISGDSVTRYTKERYSCSSCPLGCGALLHVERGRYAAKKVQRPEYESLAAFGPMLLNDDVESIIKATDICNRYGLDTISAGAALAFAFECYENGAVTTSDTGGMELKWGDAAAAVSLLEKIAEREGFGDVLADGVKRASERIGEGSWKYAIHIGGEEPAMHDPRAAPSFGTTYLVDAAPGRHTAGGAAFAESMGAKHPLKDTGLPKVRRYQYTGKGEVHKALSNFTHVVNALGLCTFGTTGMIADMPLLGLVNAATGWELTADEILMIGERIQTARHLFNLTEGIHPTSFTLPERLKGVPPLDAGPSAGVTIDIDSLVNDFYLAMSWSAETTWPSAERLETLGLKEISDKRLNRS